MPLPMPEDDFRARLGGYQANYYAPNFSGGTGDVNQAGTATGEPPATPSITDPNAGKPRPTTLLGQVHAQQNRAGGNGLQTGRAGQLSSDERADIARRGYAPFTTEGIRTAVTNAIGLMTDPVTTGLATMGEQALGLDQGTLGGISDIPGYQSLTPDQIGPYGVPNPSGGSNGNQGGAFKSTAETAGQLAGEAAGNFADPVAGAVMAGFKGGLSQSDFGGGDGGGNGNSSGGGGAPQGGKNPGGHGEYARGGVVRPRYGALPSHMQRRASGGAIDQEGNPDDSGADYTAPASVPRDGQTDNQPAMLDEGEFVITRDAAAAYDPQVLQAMNDPAMAPMIEALVATFLQQQQSGGAAAAAAPSAAAGQPARIGSAGGIPVTEPSQPMPRGMPPEMLTPVPPTGPASGAPQFNRGGVVRPRTRLGNMRAA